MTDRYVVAGNPVAHSKSPQIHAAFANQTGQDLVYETLEPKIGDFAAAAARFFADGGAGMNVTVPFKGEAADFADMLTERAAAAGSVNTLKRLPDGRRQGDNTDGAGLVRDLLCNRDVQIGDRRLLVVGAGGAARGLIGPLLVESPAVLVIANRTGEKAAILAHHFAHAGPVAGIGLAEVADHAPFDLVIDATSAGLSGTVPTLPDDLFRPGAVAYDLLYADQPTPFVRWALAHGAAVAFDGLGMLVEQAAESYRVWRGIQPDTGPVIRMLRPDDAAAS